MEYQKITNLPKNLQQSNPEKVTNENNKEIPEEKYISLEKRPQIIHNLDS